MMGEDSAGPVPTQSAGKARLVGLGVVVLILGGVFWNLELSRDSRWLEQAGAKLARREDGSVMSITLEAGLVNDVNLDRVGNLAGLAHVKLKAGYVTEAGFASLGRLRGLERLTLENVDCPSGALAGLPPLPRLDALFIDNSPRLVDVDIRSIARHENLVELKISRTSVTDAGLPALADLKQLQELMLTHNAAVTIAGLRSLEPLQQLQRLDVTGTEMTSAELMEFDAQFPDTAVSFSKELLTDLRPLLEHGIDYSHSSGKTPPGVELPPGYEPSPPGITFKLEATNARVTTDGLQLLLKYDPDYGSLRFINSNLSDEHMPLVGQFRKLSDLYVHDNHGTLTANGLRYLSDLPLKTLFLHNGLVDDEVMRFVGQITTLDYVELSGPFTAEGVKHLEGLRNVRSLTLTDQVNDEMLKSVGKLESLTELWISGPVTDAGVVHLRGLTNLWGLGISNCLVTGSTLSELRGLQKLRRLSLSPSQLSDEGLLEIAELPVTQISIADTAVTEAGLAAFKECRPDVSVHEGNRQRPQDGDDPE